MTTYVHVIKASSLTCRPCEWKLCRVVLFVEQLTCAVLSVPVALHTLLILLI